MADLERKRAALAVGEVVGQVRFRVRQMGPVRGLIAALREISVYRSVEARMTRAEELVAAAKLKRERGDVDWQVALAAAQSESDEMERGYEELKQRLGR